MFEDAQTSEPMDTDDFDLFADDDDMDFSDDQTSEPEEVVAEEQQETPVVETQQTEQAVEDTPFLDIVYNGQQMHLTKEQAITLAQKGQNYDKKVQELEALKNSRERQLFARMAEQSGMTYDQLLDSFDEQFKQANIQVRAEQLMRNEYMDQATAMRVARAELEKEELLNQRNAEQQQRNQLQQQSAQEQQKKAQFTNEFAQLLKENPGFQTKYPTFDSLPKAMQEAVKNGSGIMAAYQQVQIEELRNEVAAYKQNEKNKSMSPGSASGVGNKHVDPFEAALFGDD